MLKKNQQQLDKFQLDSLDDTDNPDTGGKYDEDMPSMISKSYSLDNETDIYFRNKEGQATTYSVNLFVLEYAGSLGTNEHGAPGIRRRGEGG